MFSLNAWYSDFSRKKTIDWWRKRENTTNTKHLKDELVKYLESTFPIRIHAQPIAARHVSTTSISDTRFNTQN